MRKINEIQKKLNELNGGEFQKLMDVYFSRTNPGQLYPIGSVIENNNTKTGTPDTLIRTNEGKYVFIEYTVQKNGVLAKFKDDIAKCLDYEKTKISPDKINKIICCCNTRLSTSDIEELSNVGVSIAKEIEVVSLDSIAFKLLNYPNITKDFLGISIDTQQILDMEDFIRFNDSGKLATPLDIDLYGRNEDVKEIVKSIGEKQITVLSGVPGVGKTRLSLECLREYLKVNPEYSVKCVRNNGQNLYDDINLYFSEAGKYIIMIDDANLLTDIQIILDLIGAQYKNINVKLLLTVREYAENKIFDKISNYDFKVFKIKKLTEPDIALVCNSYQIINERFTSRVWEISRGNPRLAVMACTIVQREKTLKSIENVIELIEKYYNDVSLHFESELQNDDLLKVASIIGFLGSVHLKDQSSTDLICEVLGIEEDVLLQLIATLHSMEIIDIFEEELVKVSDQILNTYIFFTTVFKKKLISYDIFIKNYFPKHKNRFIENLNSVFSYFYKDEYLKVIEIAVRAKFDEIKEQDTGTLIEEYLHTFSFFLQIEGLIYVQDKISRLPTDISGTFSFELEKNEKNFPSELALLSKYHRYSQYKEAIDLILIYLEKKPKEFSSVYYTLVNYYGFNDQSVYQGYAIQLKMLKKVREKYIQEKNLVLANLLIKLTGYFLRFSHEYTQMKNHKSVEFFRIPLEMKFNLPELRQLTWLSFEEIYTSCSNTRELNQYLYEYASKNSLPINEDILNFDQKFIVEIIEAVKEPNLEQLIVFNRVNNLYKSHELLLKEDLLEYDNEEYQIYKKIFSSDHMRREEEEYKTNELSSWSINFGAEEFCGIFAVCKKVSEINFLNTNSYLATRRIEFIIRKLSIENKKSVLNLYFNSDIDLMLSPSNLLLNFEDISLLYQIETEVEKSEFQHKKYWLICLYQEISKREISTTLLSKVYRYFEELDTELKTVVDISFLENFLTLDRNIFRNVLNILVEKEDVIALGILNLFIIELTEKEEIIQLFLENDIELLKKLFLRVARLNNFDFDSSILKVIVKSDYHILGELLNDIVKDKKDNFRILDSLNLHFVWKEENWRSLMKEVSNVIVDNIGDFTYYYEVEEILRSSLTLSEKELEKVSERVLLWIDIKIEEWAQNDELIKMLFRCLTNYDATLRNKWIIKLINIRPEYEFFTRLPLLPSSYEWTGSQVPTLNFRKEFFIKLNEEIEGIRFLEHKRWLQERISYLEDEIRATKIDEIKQDI